MSRGIHTKPNNGLSNDWMTPRWIIEDLGPFDLDPCRCYGQRQECAKHSYTVDDDGLAQKWFGRVWLNPPYGSALKHWLKRLAEHGDGVALVPARTEVESWFWPYIWERAHAVFFFRGRLYFERPDGMTVGNAGHGSVLAAYGPLNVLSIRRAMQPRGRLDGKLIELKTV